jgi:HSF-type DNA-binding
VYNKKTFKKKHYPTLISIIISLYMCHNSSESEHTTIGTRLHSVVANSNNTVPLGEIGDSMQIIPSDSLSTTSFVAELAANALSAMVSHDENNYKYEYERQQQQERNAFPYSQHQGVRYPSFSNTWTEPIQYFPGSVSTPPVSYRSAEEDPLFFHPYRNNYNSIGQLQQLQQPIQQQQQPSRGYMTPVTAVSNPQVKDTLNRNISGFMNLQSKFMSGNFDVEENSNNSQSKVMSFPSEELNPNLSSPIKSRRQSRRSSQSGQKTKPNPKDPGWTAKHHRRQFVHHNYHDHLHDPTTTSSPIKGIHHHILQSVLCNNVTIKEGRRKPSPPSTSIIPFPAILQSLLDTAESRNVSHIISWFPHGRAFAIHDSQAFIETIMPQFFRQTKLSSFQRQLNLYGFLRLVRPGSDRGGYYHEYCLRGRPDLTVHLHRTRIKGTRVRTTSNPEEEPNFYEMEPVSTVENSNEPTAKQEVETKYDNDTAKLSKVTIMSQNSIKGTSSMSLSSFYMLGLKLENIQEQDSWTSQGEDEGEVLSPWSEESFMLPLPEPTRVDFNIQPQQAQSSTIENYTPTTGTIAMDDEYHEVDDVDHGDGHKDDNGDNYSTMDLILFLKDVDLSSNNTPWETNALTNQITEL